MEGNPDRDIPAKGLLVIDQTPLFEEALGACHRACLSIERLKNDLHFHETRDLPAYVRWYHSSFGRHLTEVRELLASVRDKEGALALARKLHWDRFFGSSCPVHTESTLGSGEPARLSGGRARWESFDDEDAEHARPYPEDAFLEEEEDPFAQWFGSDGDEGFDEFFVRDFNRRGGAYRTRARPESPESDDDEDSLGTGDRARAYARFRARFAEEEAEAEAAQPAPHSRPKEKDSLRARLKERYRALARKLHPDVNLALSEEEKSLWNQAQAAYQAKDVEKLDLLVAITDAFSGRMPEHASLNQLRNASREIERLIAPLRKKLEEARQSRAWKFTELEDKSTLLKALERELLRNVARLRKTADHLDEQILRFTRKRQPPRSRDSARPDRILQ